MNKNKIILAIIGILLLFSFVWLFLTINSSATDKKSTSTSEPFVIWMKGDSHSDFFNWITYFKELHPEYKNTNIQIEQFSSDEDYYYSLVSAITKGKAPDLFVMNNNEKKSLFEDQSFGIDPTVINPNDFRKKYKGVFGDDLVATFIEGTGKDEIKTEYLKGIPVGYETLGIFYNRIYVQAAELKSIASLNNLISKLQNTKADVVPLGIGNGSTVKFAADIITQFFMLENDISSLGDLSGAKARQALTSYFLYGDTLGTNKYNSLFSELTAIGENNIYSFSRGNLRMIVGYPRMIHDIKKSGSSQKNLLQVSPFPHYFSGEGKTLLNYEYFSINKDTKNLNLANEILKDLTTDNGAEKFLENTPYYLPALLSLESDFLDQKIDPEYNIVLGDFYNPEYQLASFDKGIENVYDSNIISILDNNSNYLNAFETFRKMLVCKTNKISTLTNLGSSCE